MFSLYNKLNFKAFFVRENLLKSETYYYLALFGYVGYLLQNRKQLIVLIHEDKSLLI